MKVYKMQIITVGSYLQFAYVVSSAVLEARNVFITLSKKIQPNFFFFSL